METKITLQSRIKKMGKAEMLYLLLRDENREALLMVTDLYHKAAIGEIPSTYKGFTGFDFYKAGIYYMSEKEPYGHYHVFCFYISMKLGCPFGKYHYGHHLADEEEIEDEPLGKKLMDEAIAEGYNEEDDIY